MTSFVNLSPNHTVREGIDGVIPRRSEDFIFLLAGALLRIDVYVLGRLSAAELFFLLCLPFYLQRGSSSTAIVKKFYWLISAWVFAVIISDLWNSTDPNLMLRGLARPLIILIMFMTMVRILADSLISVKFFFIGLLFSGILNTVFHTDFRAAQLEVAEAYSYYAFVYTPLVIATVSLAAWMLGQKSGAAAAAFLVVAAFLVSLNFSRTTAMIFLFTAIINIYWHSVYRVFLRCRRGMGTTLSIVIFGAFTVGVLFLLLSIYISLALDGVLGARIAEKVFDQTQTPLSSPVINMILNGRHYNISNYFMIVDNPIFGTGSWPVEGPYVFRAMEFLGNSVSDAEYVGIADNRGIGHSILFGSWANYGILPVFFWGFVASCTVRYMTIIMQADNKIRWLMTIYLVLFLISIFFNNLNSLNRVLAAMIPALLSATLSAAERRRGHVKRTSY
ncbi:hypothetical protein [Mesorhizobium sp. M0684]|uniref:hypothetical protein n=1 Tax=Mesorhizobium sp. M0684 TaxID=2956986 RepID=UPI00333C2A65